MVPVFILDRRLLRSRYNGERRTAFQFGGLRALDGSLRERGSRRALAAFQRARKAG
ncbi:MAG TPA: hypothetical protein VIE88_06155 [Vicinamibacteria bacterium]